MRILQAASEFFPYSKTGGLADMVAGLSGALALDHEVTVASPLYRGIRDQFPDLEAISEGFDLPLGDEIVSGKWWRHQLLPNLTALLLENDVFYNRPSLYMEHGEGYWDNPERFIFFSKAVVHLAPDFDVLHMHDWQTAIVPMLLKERARQGASRTLYTIHNLAYQGSCPGDRFALTNLPAELFHERGPEHFGDLNFMKAGLHYADAITTVSPQYAQEILTDQFGEGLSGETKKRQDSLTGILNGVDYAEWRTRDNPHLAADYDSEDLSGKTKCKIQLLKTFKLPDEGLPLFSVVSRLVEQKGIRQLLEALAELLPGKRFQFVLLGSGDEALMEMLLQLRAKFPNQVGVEIGYDQSLSHKIEAGSDFFLMPSRFEPCGLNQLYSLRYGTIPIVHAVGGLKDTITDIQNPGGNGIRYDQFQVSDLRDAVHRAVKLFQNPEQLDTVRRTGMNQDFSWSKAAKEFERIYNQVRSMDD